MGLAVGGILVNCCLQNGAVKSYEGDETGDSENVAILRKRRGFVSENRGSEFKE